MGREDDYNSDQELEEGNVGGVYSEGEEEDTQREFTAAAPVDPKFRCRFHEAPFPEINDLVMVTVQRISEMGAYVVLDEYNGIEGMVMLSELSRRRIRSVNRLVRIGKKEVAQVLRVDRDKGYIDLSKRRVSPEEAEAFEERFAQNRTVHSLLRHVAEKNDISLETLYQEVAWPLVRQHKTAYVALKLGLTEPERMWGGLPDFSLGESVRRDMQQGIIRRLTPQRLKLRADLEVVCFAYEGVEAVKRALAAGEAASPPEIAVKARLVAPPLYVLTAQCSDKAKGLEVMNAVVEAIGKSILEAKGQMVVKLKPKAVNEQDEKALADLMKRSELENNEVAGDEDTELND